MSDEEEGERKLNVTDKQLDDLIEYMPVVFENVEFRNALNKNTIKHNVKSKFMAYQPGSLAGHWLCEKVKGKEALTYDATWTPEELGLCSIRSMYAHLEQIKDLPPLISGGSSTNRAPWIQNMAHIHNFIVGLRTDRNVSVLIQQYTPQEVNKALLVIGDIIQTWSQQIDTIYWSDVSKPRKYKKRKRY